MADSFAGEIRILPYTYAPYQWAACDGRQMPINQYQLLYAVIGNLYGGDQQTYFNLPNLQGQVPMGAGTGTGLTPRVIAKQVGTESVTLNTSQTAAHTHTVTAKTVPPAITAANVTGTPASDSWLSRGIQVQSTTTNLQAYTPNGTPDVTLAAQTIGFSCGNAVGAALPHENRQPYLPMRFCISLYGEYPLRPD